MRDPKIFGRVVWLAVAGMMLCACASNQAGTEMNTHEESVETSQRACFKPGQVTGFTTLDRTNLIVYAPTKSSAYHVRISPPARELGFANRIAFDTGETRICGYAGEGVVFDSGGMARRYFVTDVYQLDVAAVQNLIVEFSGEIDIEPQNTLDVEIERDIEPEDE